MLRLLGSTKYLDKSQLECIYPTSPTYIQRIAKLNEFDDAPEPRRAADTAGAVCGLGAIHPAMRYGLLTTKQPATFSHFLRPKMPGAPAVSRTRIAW